MQPTLPAPTTPMCRRAKRACAADPQADTVLVSSSFSLGGGINLSIYVRANLFPTTRTELHHFRSNVRGATLGQKRALHAPSVQAVKPTSGKPFAASVAAA